MDNYANSTARVIDKQPDRPGGVSDTKQNLANRIQSLQDAVNGLTQVLETSNILRPGSAQVGVSKATPEPPSMDSVLSQHLSELGKRVQSVTNQIEQLTQRIDV